MIVEAPSCLSTDLDYSEQQAGQFLNSTKISHSSGGCEGHGQGPDRFGVWKDPLSVNDGMVKRSNDTTRKSGEATKATTVSGQEGS